MSSAGTSTVAQAATSCTPRCPSLNLITKKPGVEGVTDWVGDAAREPNRGKEGGIPQEWIILNQQQEYVWKSVP